MRGAMPSPANTVPFVDTPSVSLRVVRTSQMPDDALARSTAELLEGSSVAGGRPDEESHSETAVSSSQRQAHPSSEASPKLALKDASSTTSFGPASANSAANSGVASPPGASAATPNSLCSDGGV